MAKISMGQQEKVWQAERDARSLIEAEAINCDNSRMSLAKNKLEEMKQDKIKELGAIHAVSNKMKNKKNMKDVSKPIKKVIKKVMSKPRVKSNNSEVNRSLKNINGKKK
jgi:hypothetical protein